MVRAITILFVLMAASFVQAQALAIRTTETDCTGNACTQIVGTGACAFVGNIDERSVYITAAHNINNARTVHVGYGGKWWGAAVKYREYTADADYAIIETSQIPAQKCFEVASRVPVGGAPAMACGYSQGIYNMRVLRAKIRVTPSGRYFSKVVAKGDSGGPILVNGQVVGIIKGHDTQQTIYTDSVRIRQRLVTMYGRMPCCNCEPPVIVQNEPQPQPDQNNDGEQINALVAEIDRLRGDLDKLSNTKIPVWIMNDKNEPIAKQTYPLGQPIKLRFKHKKMDKTKEEQPEQSSPAGVAKETILQIFQGR